MSYLLQLADELMTTPLETLEMMYNEAMVKCDPNTVEDVNQVAKYARIAGLLDQVAIKRFCNFKYMDGQYRIVKRYTDAQ